MRAYKYAEIWVDSAGMPVQTKIVEKNDDDHHAFERLRET
jgi:hypothetical protein